MKYILSIDPGNEYSAYSLLDEELRPIKFGKITNDEMVKLLREFEVQHGVNELSVAIEMVASYGMAVGRTVFETCVWIGRFTEILSTFNPTYIYRKEEKINLCNSMKAKDSNIRQALIDRFGVVGTKKDKGWFYGVSKDVWSAIAVGVTYNDLYLNK